MRNREEGIKYHFLVIGVEVRLAVVDNEKWRPGHCLSTRKAKLPEYQRRRCILQMEGSRSTAFLHFAHLLYYPVQPRFFPFQQETFIHDFFLVYI